MVSYSVLLTDGSVVHFDDERELGAVFSEMQSKGGLRVQEAQLWMEGSTSGVRIDAVFSERHVIAVYQRIRD